MDDICLYMDNLSVHTSAHAKDRMDELGFAYVYSAPYSPAYNGIEEVFAIFKRNLKTERLKLL